MVARLLEHFPGSNLDLLARATDRQIVSLYFHYRNSDGKLTLSDEAKEIEQPPTFEKDLMDLNQLRYLIEMSDVDYERLKGDLERKYGI